MACPLSRSAAWCVRMHNESTETVHGMPAIRHIRFTAYPLRQRTAYAYCDAYTLSRCMAWGFAWSLHGVVSAWLLHGVSAWLLHGVSAETVPGMPATRHVYGACAQGLCAAQRARCTISHMACHNTSNVLTHTVACTGGARRRVHPSRPSQPAHLQQQHHHHHQQWQRHQ